MKRIAALCLTVAVLFTLLATPVSATSLSPTSVSVTPVSVNPASVTSVTATSETVVEVKTYGTRNYDEANEILRLVNKERAEEGLAPLTMDPQLMEYAMHRAEECAVLYSHTRPDGSDCFTIMAGDWRNNYSAGENIAAGYYNAGAVMGDDDDPNSGGWMNSEGHKANILYSDFQSIGIGCFYQEDGTKYWAQYFSGAPASGSYNQSGAIDVNNVSINVGYNYLFPAMDELNDNNELELYEGTTSPVTLYLINGGWEYASAIRLSGGYTLRSTNSNMTVDQESATVTGKTSGTSGLIVDFSGELSYEVPATIWPKPTISCSTDASGATTLTWEDPGNNVYLFGKEEDDDDWYLLTTPEDGSEYEALTNPDEVWSYKLSAWLIGVGWQDLTEPIVIWPCETPKVTQVTLSNGGITVSWDPVEGAGKYRVYVKTTGGWSRIGDTTGTSFTYTNAQAGTTYAFTVRCLNADGTKVISDYDKTGKSITYGNLSKPVITKLTNTATGVKVTWGAVPGAAKYRVYVKTASGWLNIGNTTGTSLTYTKAVSGETYTFTVRCITPDGKGYTSGYDATGKTITYIGQPKVSVSNAAKGVKISWGAIAGAEKYRVYVKTASGWTNIGNTTGTSLTYTKAVSGETYTFTVRCVSADGKTLTSSYDTTGKTITYIGQPAISSLESTASGVKISWNAVSGAEKYRVYVKTASGWTNIGNTTGTSLTYTKAVSGETYTFTVRCITADGKNHTSSYDTKGKTITYIK